MKKIILVALVSTMVFAGGNVMSAIAPIDDKIYYIGVSGSANETYTGSRDYTGHKSGEFSNAGMTLMGGYHLSKSEKSSYGVEVRIGTSIWMEDSEDITTNYGGIYLRGDYRLSEAFGIYGALGGAVVDFNGNSNGEAHVGPSGIIGIELISRRNSLAFFADYTSTYIDGDIGYFYDNVNYDSINLGVRYAF